MFDGAVNRQLTQLAQRDLGADAENFIENLKLTAKKKLFVNPHITHAIVKEYGFVGSEEAAAEGKGLFKKETNVTQIGFDDSRRITQRTVYRVDSKSPEQLIKAGGMISLGVENGSTCMKNHAYGNLMISNLISTSETVAGTMIRGSLLQNEKYSNEIEAMEKDTFRVSGDPRLSLYEALTPQKHLVTPSKISLDHIKGITIISEASGDTGIKSRFKPVTNLAVSDFDKKTAHPYHSQFVN